MRRYQPNRGIGATRSRATRMAGLAGLAVLLWLGAPAAASAQPPGGRPIVVQPDRDLVFGDLLPGIPKPVTRLDPTDSGMYSLRGPGGAEVSISFNLPAALVSGAGATLTIAFGADDGGFAQEPNQAASVGFDPNVPFMAMLGPNGRGYIWLGATAQPTSGQAPGLYEGTVVLTISRTGN